MFTVVATTWSWDPTFTLQNTWLHKSFTHYNPHHKILNIHYNRNQYRQLETDFITNLGSESECILYKMFLQRQNLALIDTEYVIVCDANDVYCTGKVDFLHDFYDLDDYIIFGHEKNDWPKIDIRSQWPNYQDYTPHDIAHRNFLNGGCFVTSTENYRKLLDNIVVNYLPLKFHTKNDQGIFVYHMNTHQKPEIKLDYSGILVLNTYDRNIDEFYMKNGKVYYKKDNKAPIFIHDNGTPWGGQQFVNRFGLSSMNYLK